MNSGFYSYAYDTGFYATSCAGLILCIMLMYIDFKTFLLPNIWVGCLAITGIIHHALSDFTFASYNDMLIGMAMGGGLLLIVRHFANKKYKQETMGLGDVKLMMAGGLWLGTPNILIALSIGAFAGAIIGYVLYIVKRHIQKQDIALMSTHIPAGPGFITGLVFTFLWFHMAV